MIWKYSLYLLRNLWATYRCSTRSAYAELPTVTRKKKSYLLRKSEGNTTIRKRIQKIRIHETPQKTKKQQQQKIETSLNPYTQCSACNTRGRMIMEWIRTSATYTSAELKSARACEPPQWVTPSGTSWISSPGCRRWVDGETVEVLHVHCFLSRMQQCHEHDRWTDDLFQASLYGERDFILMDISSTLWLCIWHIGILEQISSDTREVFIFWLLKMWSVIFMWWFSVPPRWVDTQRNLREYLPRVSAVCWWGNRWSSACALLSLAPACITSLLRLLYVLYTCMLTVLLQPFTRAIYNSEFSASFKLEWLVVITHSVWILDSVRSI